ncbi:MAG: hypothetical protein ACRCX2_38200 [Paraclostridium sp.]
MDKDIVERYSYDIDEFRLHVSVRLHDDFSSVRVALVTHNVRLIDTTSVDNDWVKCVQESIFGLKENYRESSKIYDKSFHDILNRGYYKSLNILEYFIYMLEAVNG